LHQLRAGQGLLGQNGPEMKSRPVQVRTARRLRLGPVPKGCARTPILFFHLASRRIGTRPLRQAVAGWQQDQKRLFFSRLALLASPNAPSARFCCNNSRCLPKESQEKQDEPPPTSARRWRSEKTRPTIRRQTRSCGLGICQVTLAARSVAVSLRLKPSRKCGEP